MAEEKKNIKREQKLLIINMKGFIFYNFRKNRIRYIEGSRNFIVKVKCIYFFIPTYSKLVLSYTLLGMMHFINLFPFKRLRALSRQYETLTDMLNAKMAPHQISLTLAN